MSRRHESDPQDPDYHDHLHDDHAHCALDDSAGRAYTGRPMNLPTTPLPCGRRRHRSLSLLASIVLLSVLAVGCESTSERLRLDSPPNIVVIVVDALRPDHLSAYEYERPTSPNLERLAADGVVFSSAFASAPKTMPSVPQILTSSHFPDLASTETLMSVLDEGGYHDSAAIINNPYVTKWLGRMDPTLRGVLGGEFDADEITTRALDWLDEDRQEPVALYLHYLDTHTPYTAPERFARSFVDPAYTGPVGLRFDYARGAAEGIRDVADRQRIIDLYDGTVLYTDAAIGHLLEGLKARRLYDDSLIFVTADHGEEFWEHGRFFHGQSLYDEQLRVPLIVKFPGAWRAGATVHRLVGTVDILPTISELLYKGKESAHAQCCTNQDWVGVSLTTAFDLAPPDRSLFATVGRADDQSPARHAVRTARHKYIVNVSDGAEELYAFANDPGETSNVIESSPPALARLRRSYAAFAAPLSEAGYQLEIENVDGAEHSYRAELRAIPTAPFVNPERLGLEAGDRIELGPHTDGISVEGSIGPGDSDRIRFDVLTPQGSIRLAAQVDDRPIDPGSVLLGASETRPAAMPIDVPLEDLGTEKRADRPRSRAAGGVRLSLWRIGSSENIIAPGLTEADNERLRSLGYLR